MNEKLIAENNHWLNTFLKYGMFSILVIKVLILFSNSIFFYYFHPYKIWRIMNEPYLWCNFFYSDSPS